MSRFRHFLPLALASTMALAVPALAASGASSTTAAASPSASPSPSPNDTLKHLQGWSDDLKYESDYRLKRARRLFENEYIASAQKPEISRALDRAEAHVKLQVDLVTKLVDAIKTPDETALKQLQEEVEATRDEAKTSSDDVEAVRTHDDKTEATLQAMSDEIAKIADRADEIADKVADLRGEQNEDGGAQANAGDDDDDDGGNQGMPPMPGMSPMPGMHHHHGGGDDAVNLGGSITVNPGEQVDDAVATGGSVTVSGEVRGDAVAVGGDVHVTDTGRVRGDATAVGGKVIVDDGGRVDGQKSSVGPGALARGLRFGTPFHSFGFAKRLLLTGLFYLAFFLIGMVVIAAAPLRMEAMVAAMERDWAKASLVGALGWACVAVAFLLFGALSFVLIGIPLLLILVPATWLAAFCGYVALALTIGKHLPTGVIPTPVARLALGGAIVVGVFLLPIWMSLPLWLLFGLPALGVVLMTRFGQPPAVLTTAPPATPA